MAQSLMDMADSITSQNKVNPVTQDFDESKSAAARTNAIIQQDSPLMQSAATAGTQAAAKRGLANSSIGIQSAQQAVINSAAPIATADAQLYGQNSLANLAAKNSAASTNAQLGVQAGTTAMTLGSQEKQTADTLANDAAKFAVTSGQTQQQIDAQKQQFATSAAQAQQQIDAQKEQFAQSLGLQAKDLDLRRDTLTTQQQQFLDSLNLQQKQLDQQQSQFSQSLSANQANFGAELSQKDQQFKASQAQQLVMQNADNATKLTIEQMDAAWRKDLQNSTNLTNSWSQMMQNIQAIQNNANLDAATKKTLIDNNLQSFNAFASFWKKTSGVDVSDLLAFGTGGSTTSAQPAPGTTRGVQPLPLTDYNGTTYTGGGA